MFLPCVLMSYWAVTGGVCCFIGEWGWKWNPERLVLLYGTNVYNSTPFAKFYGRRTRDSFIHSI